MNTVLCPGCGETFTRKVGRGRPRLWCSDRCRERNKPASPSNSRHARRARVARRETEGPPSCARCGEDISDRRPNARYCSLRCGEIARGARLPEPLPVRRCAFNECGVEFQPKYRNQRCCCEAHGKRLWQVEAALDGRIKREPWNDARRDRYHRRRALKKAASTGNPVHFSEIAERDGWNCGICLDPVDASIEWPHPLSPSLDHVVALTKGGIHDPSNVQLAHLRCNSVKGNRDGNQLLLTG